MWFHMFFVLIPAVFCASKSCPGGSFSCPDTSTCCELADKSYGCCPLKNAVCCDDHIHCCPSNTKCEAGMCIELHGTNVTAKRLNSNDNTCFESDYACPVNNTCCKASVPGFYECCPLASGICCDDYLHCCPQGTICDVDKQRCVGKGFVSEMYDSRKNRAFKLSSSKELTLLQPSNVNNVICPGYYQCPDGYTCCLLPQGTYGCCPFLKATCCPDKLHCCPHNMKCDTTSQTCLQGNISIPSLQKEIAKPLSSAVTCPDNSTCADTTTCCRTSPERFGCCPYEDAVCCEDLRHCCPSDYICDVIGRRCVSKAKLSKASKHKKLLYI